MFFFVGALPIDQSKIKHTKKLKEIPCKHVLENLLEIESLTLTFCPKIFPGF